MIKSSQISSYQAMLEDKRRDAEVLRKNVDHNRWLVDRVDIELTEVMSERDELADSVDLQNRSYLQIAQESEEQACRLEAKREISSNHSLTIQTLKSNIDQHKSRIKSKELESAKVRSDISTIKNNLHELRKEQQKCLNETREAEQVVNQQQYQLDINENNLIKKQRRSNELKYQTSSFICENHNLREMAYGQCGNINEPWQLTLIREMFACEQAIMNLREVVSKYRTKLRISRNALQVKQQQLEGVNANIYRCEQQQLREERVLSDIQMELLELNSTLQSDLLRLEQEVSNKRVVDIEIDSLKTEVENLLERKLDESIKLGRIRERQRQVENDLLAKQIELGVAQEELADAEQQYDAALTDLTLTEMAIDELKREGKIDDTQDVNINRVVDRSDMQDLDRIAKEEMAAEMGVDVSDLLSEQGQDEGGPGTEEGSKVLSDEFESGRNRITNFFDRTSNDLYRAGIDGVGDIWPAAHSALTKATFRGVMREFSELLNDDQPKPGPR